MSSAEIVGQGLGELLESPRWDPVRRRLSFVDILGGAVFVHDADSVTTRSHDTGLETVGAALKHRGAYRLFGDVAMFDWSPGRQPVSVVALPGDLRSNDAARDPWGAWWVGRMSPDEDPGVGELLRITGGVVTREASGLTVPNGMGWSPDGRTMYFVESADRTVYAVPASPAGIAWGRRRPLIMLTEGFPDGLCVTGHGLWVAHWAGACVSFHDFEGSEIVRHEIPARQVSACALAGDDLYVTSASEHYNDEDLREDPLAGSLFVLRDVGRSPRNQAAQGDVLR